MKMYFKTIGAAMIIISAVNIALGTASWINIVADVVWCTSLQFILDGIVAVTVHKLPDRWFGIDNPRFQVSDREKQLYKKLNVRRWKDKVWELGSLGGFSKKTLKEPGNPQYIEKFIVECNKGVTVHKLSCPIGLIAMLTVSGISAFSIALPVAIVNWYLNVLPTMVLRYNTPKLKSVLMRLNRHTSQDAENVEEEEIPNSKTV